MRLMTWRALSISARLHAILACEFLRHVADIVADLADEVDGTHDDPLVAAQVEVKSKVGNQFIIFQLQALTPGAVNPVPTWVNLHRPAQQRTLTSDAATKSMRGSTTARSRYAGPYTIPHGSFN